jgi:hypothetical protein
VTGARQRNHAWRAQAAALAIALLLPVLAVQAQTPRDSTYKVLLMLGAGLSRDLGTIDTPSNGGESSRGGLGASVRLMWHPDHLLMAGVESGYFRISTLTLPSDTVADSYISLNAVPMLVVFAMTKYGFDVAGGLGIYRYSVTAESGRTGFKGGSYSNEIGYMASVGYNATLVRGLDAGVELKMHFIPDREITALLAMARVTYRVFEY